MQTTKDLSELLKARDQMMAAIAFTVNKESELKPTVTEINEVPEHPLLLQFFDLTKERCK